MKIDQSGRGELYSGYQLDRVWITTILLCISLSFIYFYLYIFLFQCTHVRRTHREVANTSVIRRELKPDVHARMDTDWRWTKSLARRVSKLFHLYHFFQPFQKGN